MEGWMGSWFLLPSIIDEATCYKASVSAILSMNGS